MLHVGLDLRAVILPSLVIGWGDDLTVLQAALERAATAGRVREVASVISQQWDSRAHGDPATWWIPFAEDADDESLRDESIGQLSRLISASVAARTWLLDSGLTSRDPRRRAAIARWLLEDGDVELRTAVRALGETDPEPEVRLAVISASSWERQDAAEWLVGRATNDPSGALRAAALLVLADKYALGRWWGTSEASVRDVIKMLDTDWDPMPWTMVDGRDLADLVAARKAVDDAPEVQQVIAYLQRRRRPGGDGPRPGNQS
jgi:hypothetical protein